MVNSIGGLNDRWTQIAALQRPKAPSGLDSGAGIGNGGTTTTDLTPISPVAGSTASPLSNNLNFLLSVFGGSSQSSNQLGAASSGLASARDSTSASAQLQPDAQLSMTVPSVTAISDGITGSTLVQELQVLVSGAGQGGAISSGVATPSAAAPAGSDAVRNSGSVVPSWRNGWDNTTGPADRARQQVGLAAYASGNSSGPDNETASVQQGISA